MLQTSPFFIGRAAALHRIGSGAVAAAAAASELAVFQTGAEGENLTSVTIGIVNSSSDAPFFLAEQLGYYRDAGIAAKMIAFNGAPTMIASVGAGQIDVGSGGPSAGLYNAIGAEIDVRMVADKATPAPGYGYAPLMVRSELVSSGKYKSPRDLKGMRFAEAGSGSTTSASIARLLNSVGLHYSDLQHVFLGFPDQIVAFSNGAIDAAMPLEPNATIAERQGVAIRIMGNDKWSPYEEQAVVFYGPTLLRRRRDIGTRFMVAYLRAVRFYNDALVGGHLRGRMAKDVIDVLVRTTPVKDPTIYREMVSQAVNVDGKLNMNSLAEDLAFFKRQGWITAPVTAAQSVDNEFAVAAVRQLGPYKPNV